MNWMPTERVSEPWLWVSVAEYPVPGLPAQCHGHGPLLRATESLAIIWGQYRAWLTGLAQPWKEEKLVKCLLTKEHLKRKG